MTYRKIEVDGKMYEYVVGKSDVKVRGFPSVGKEQVGYVIHYDYETRVQPSHIAKFIREQLNA